MSTRESMILAPVWMDGEPPLPHRDEWFIAETIHGDRVVLRALPEEWTYDYTTADGTRMAAKSIRRWMQFPDSEYLPAHCSSPVSAEVTDDGECQALIKVWQEQFAASISAEEIAADFVPLVRADASSQAEIERLKACLADLAEAARNACNAAQHTPLVEALFEADRALSGSKE